MSVPGDANPSWSCAAANVRCTNDGRAVAHWVWPDYVSVELGFRTGCGAHPDWSPGHSVRAIDAIDRPIGMGTLLRGWANTHRLCGYGFDFDVDADLSKLTGRTGAASRAERLTDLERQSWTMRDISSWTDSSPDGSLVLHWTTTRLSIARAAGGAPLAAFDLPADQRVVMIEWATGPNVARWAAAVERVRQMSRARPRPGR